MATPNTAPYQNKDVSEFPLFPEVEADLSNCDGNVFAVIGTVKKAMKRARIDQEAIDAFQAEATSGDYDHALQTCMRTVDVV